MIFSPFDLTLRLVRIVIKAMQIAVPIILIVTLSINFSQAVASHDANALSKAKTKAIFQGIAAVVIFAVPTLVSTLMKITINDDTYKSQYEKFSSLLFELRAKVEEAKNFKEGGEQPMEENKVVETPVEETVVEETPAVENFENNEEPVVEEPAIEEPAVEEPVTEFEEETPAVVEEPTVEETSNTEFEALQNDFNELQTSFEALQNELTSAQERIATFEAEIETLNNTNNSLQQELSAAQATIATYEENATAEENERKDTLIQDYEKVLSAEEITPIREAVADFSYDELESKLAVIFSRKNLSGESRKVPLPEPEESEFAKLIKNYRK